MLAVLRQAPFIGKMRYFFLDRYQSLTTRVGLIFICLFTTLLCAFLWKDLDIGGSVVPGLIPIIVLVGLGILTIVYNNMERLGIAIIMVTMILDDGISTGTDTKIMFSFVLLWVWTGLWLFKMLIVERRISLRASPVNLPIVLFIFAVLLSLYWSSNFSEIGVVYLMEDKFMVRLMTALVLIISPITMWLYSNHIHKISTLRFILWWFIIIGGIFLFLRLATGGVQPPFNAKGQFPTWVGVLALGQLLFNPDLKKWMRLILAGIIGGWIYVTMTLGISWLSGWLPLIGGCMVLIFLYSRKIFTVLLIAGLIALTINEVAVQSQIGAETEESGNTRQEAWDRALAVTARHPLFGTGPAGYHFYFLTTLTGRFQLSHNNYIDIIAQTGVFGFTIWIILWGCIGLVTWRTFRLTQEVGGFRRGLANSLAASYCCSLVAMMLGDWVTPFPYTQTLAGIDYTIWAWILPGLTGALYFITKDEMEARSKAETTLALPDTTASDS
jgi:O-antigen ligase